MTGNEREEALETIDTLTIFTLLVRCPTGGRPSDSCPFAPLRDKDTLEEKFRLAESLPANKRHEMLAFHPLFEIEGYKASAILTSDGEVLYDTTPPKTSGNFGAWMAVFNNLFNHSCDLSESSGFLACQQVSMRTGEEIVIIRNSGQNCHDGFRLLVIIDHHGNEALIHRKLDNLLPPLMQHLTRNPDNLVPLIAKISGAISPEEMAEMRYRNCDCTAQADPLHCNKCDHAFCGSCQIVFKQVNDAGTAGSRKKACPNCLSTDLYRKMKLHSKMI